jgi:hypothetical protein
MLNYNSKFDHIVNYTTKVEKILLCILFIFINALMLAEVYYGLYANFVIGCYTIACGVLGYLRRALNATELN